eukprot:ANDGO_04274.mRNA.1 U3 small nucleolar RNA-associated protein 25
MKSRKRAATSSSSFSSENAKRKHTKRKRLAEEEVRRKFQETQDRRAGKQPIKKQELETEYDRRSRHAIYDEKSASYAEMEKSNSDSDSEPETSTHQKFLSSLMGIGFASSSNRDGSDEDGCDDDADDDAAAAADDDDSDGDDDASLSEDGDVAVKPRRLQKEGGGGESDGDHTDDEANRVQDGMFRHSAFEADEETNPEVLHNVHEHLKEITTSFEAFPFSTAPAKPGELRICEDAKVGAPFESLGISRIQVFASAALSNKVKLSAKRPTSFDALVKSYADIYCAMEEQEMETALRSACASHIMSHVQESRAKIIRNNTIVKRAAKENWTDDIPDGVIRDQGFTRCKILLLVPFRHTAFIWAKMFMEMASQSMDGIKVENLERLFAEFGPDDNAESERDDGADDAANASSSKSKPADFKHIFRGNTDDCFRVGISFSKKHVKMFSHPFSSDIVIASPLGLKMLDPSAKATASDAEPSDVGALDFLSSVEIAVIDLAHVLSMQNWQHCEFCFDSLNKQPREMHPGTDVTRVREWNLNDDSLRRRQTIVLSAFYSPEHNSLLLRKCMNERGCCRLKLSFPESDAQLGRVVHSVRQLYYRVEPDERAVSAAASQPAMLAFEESRFKYFCDSVIPRLEHSNQKYVLIFVPSYLDFVRVRNFMKKRVLLQSVFVSEYTHPSEAERARQLFREGHVRCMVVTERWYFFIRKAVRKARHCIFYALPEISHFYSEILNNLDPKSEQEHSSIILYNKYDVPRLERVCGTDRTQRMLTSEKKVHLFV